MVKIYGNDMFVIDSNVKGSEDQSAHPNEEDTVVFFHGFPWYVKVILWSFLTKVFHVNFVWINNQSKILFLKI